MAADESTLTADASDIVSVLNLSVSTLSHNVCWNFSVSSRSRHCLITFVGIRRSRHCLTMFFLEFLGLFSVSTLSHNVFFGIPRSLLGLDTVSQRFLEFFGLFSVSTLSHNVFWNSSVSSLQARNLHRSQAPKLRQLFYIFLSLIYYYTVVDETHCQKVQKSR